MTEEYQRSDEEAEFQPSTSGELEHLDDLQSRLAAIGVDTSSLLEPEDAEEVERRRAEEAEALKKEEKIREYEAAVEALGEETAALRKQLEDRLKDDVDNGRVIGMEKAGERLREIDEIVARGPARRSGYNGHRGDKWYRDQVYYATLDDKGNIVGDFVLPQDPSVYANVTGKPLNGRYIVHRNPTPAAETAE